MAPIRLQMKDAGLFSIRDSFALYLLRCAPIPVLAQFISYFSFESITDQHKFRDAGGILYLLSIFHATHPDINLQAAVGIIIRDVLSHIDDNKKIISKYIDDPEVVENLFRSPVDNTKQKIQRINESESDAQESIGIEEFIKWYYAEERTAKREAVEAKIQKQLSPQDLNFKSKQEKSAKSNQSKIKKRKDKFSRSTITTLKNVTDNKEKCKQKGAKSASNIKLRSDAKAEAKKERQKVREEKWNVILAQFNSNLDKIDANSSHPWSKYSKATRNVNNIREYY